MACFNPRKAYRLRFPSRGVTFDGNHRDAGEQVTLPCNQCRGCRRARQREWQTRLFHESKLYPPGEVCFVTMTINAEHYPEDGCPSPRHVQLFMKRLRKAHPGLRIRYFCAAEYGGKTWRLHYHAIIFGYAFPDRVPTNRSKAGFPQFISAELNELWQMGFCWVSEFTAETAGYVAGYAVKKVNGRNANDHYWRDHPHTGEEVLLKQEFCLMSSRPGIGGEFYEQFASDFFPNDFCLVDVGGRRVKRPVPAYYKRLLAKVDLASSEAVTDVRIERAQAPNVIANNTPERLATRDESLRLKTERLRRNLDEEEF